MLLLQNSLDDVFHRSIQNFFRVVYESKYRAFGGLSQRKYYRIRGDRRLKIAEQWGQTRFHFTG